MKEGFVFVECCKCNTEFGVTVDFDEKDWWKKKFYCPSHTPKKRRPHDPEVTKKYYQDNKERVLENARRYYRENREKILAKWKEKYDNDPEYRSKLLNYWRSPEYRATKKAWDEKNPRRDRGRK